MFSGGSRVVRSCWSPWTVANVSVAMAGGRSPTPGICDDGAAASSPVAPIRPLGPLVSESTK